MKNFLKKWSEKEVSMKLSRMLVLCFVVALSFGVMPFVVGAEEFKIAVLHNDQDPPQAYQPLAEHLARRGISVKLIEAPTYDTMTKMLSEGQVDAMFSGPGIPGSMFVIYQLRLKQTLAGLRPQESRMRQAMLSR